VVANERAFQRLRTRARSGEVGALAALRAHVQRRLRAGWHVSTVARRLNLTRDEVMVMAGDALRSVPDLRPRLVKDVTPDPLHD
jgi:transposase-like protein